ncbi:HD-GYP domain-containing protein [Silvibacterium sp.]|uniref:HD-GYP domain-containing protein n=1 Tax=Silvibacterium sp. TaxID=1964179 RepID=UPI0039E6DBDC
MPARADNRFPASPRLTGTVSGMVRSQAEESDISHWLAALRDHDEVTYQHSIHLAELVAGFAAFLGLARIHQLYLIRAALLHDVGKITIPRELLAKTGLIDAREYEHLRSHAEAGFVMLMSGTGLPAEIIDVVRHHHEKLDGSGYPDGLIAYQIAPAVRLVTICDIYAALTEHRPYRTPLKPAEALTEMESLHGQLDSMLLMQFRLFILRSHSLRQRMLSLLRGMTTHWLPGAAWITQRRMQSSH